MDRPVVLDGDALELGVVVEGLDAFLPAVAALLVPAEGRLYGAGGPGVDEDLPGFYGVGHAQGAGDVSGPHAGDESVRGVVGDPDGLVFLVEWHDDEDRAEDLLSGEAHVRFDPGVSG